MDGIEIRNFWYAIHFSFSLFLSLFLSLAYDAHDDWSRGRRVARGIAIMCLMAGSANSIQASCVPHAKWKTRKCQGGRKTHLTRRQRWGSRLLRWRLTTPAASASASASAGVSLAVCLFYEAPLKNDSPRSLPLKLKARKYFFARWKDTPFGLRTLTVPRVFYCSSNTLILQIFNNIILYQDTFIYTIILNTL